jgi:hypothetical protein
MDLNVSCLSCLDLPVLNIVVDCCIIETFYVRAGGTWCMECLLRKCFHFV